MQENNLEGQVQNIMEGFTIDPSEKVWCKVHADIASHKKSRFGALPAALLIIVFLFTTFFLRDLEIRKPVTISSTHQDINQTKQLTKESKNNLYKKEVAIASINNKTITGNKDFDKVDLNGTKKIRRIQKSNINTIARHAIAIPQEKADNRVSEEIEIPGNKNVEEIKDEEVVVINYDKKDSPQQINAVKELLKTDTTIVKRTKPQEQPTNKTAIVKVKRNSKWEFFAAVSGGRFSTGNRYLGQTANSEYYYDNAYASNTGPPANSSGYYQPSQVKPGFSFNTVVKASRKLSGKTALAAGLGYQYAGTSMSTGQRLSGISREYNFAVGTINKFHSKYHFIQLPVEIQSMIGKGNKLPFYWNAGITLSRLISVDALQFDRIQGRYFKDNSYFNNNTIAVSAGLSLAILKTQWLIGPQFYYSLTPVAGKGLYDKTHYSFLGLQLQKKL